MGRLQGFNGSLTAQGKLLLQDTLLVAELPPSNNAGPPPPPPKLRERRVFLFEQILIFSEMIESGKRGSGSSFSNASYVYKASLKSNKMGLEARVEGEPLRFLLLDRTPGHPARFLVQANSPGNRADWVRQLARILDMQGDFLRALQSPIAYQQAQRQQSSHAKD